MERTIEAIAAMAAEAGREGAEAIAAVGTAGLRIASNGASFLDAVRQRSGVEIEVISGEEEGRLAYLAATSGLGVGAGGSLVVFDTGGGSSQFTFGDGENVDERFSLNVGAVRFTERFGLAGPSPTRRSPPRSDAIAAELARLDGRSTPETLVGMGGAVTNLAAIKHALATYDPRSSKEPCSTERRSTVRSSSTARERPTSAARSSGSSPSAPKSFWPARASSAPCSTSSAATSLTVSDRGLRHGLLDDRFGAAQPSGSSLRVHSVEQ